MAIKKEFTGSGFPQIMMLGLSLFVLAALVVQLIFALPDSATLLLARIDTLICIYFLVDFFTHLIWARDKTRYFFIQWGWIDLLSSIPFMPFLRWGRIIRVVRILMIIRSLRSAKLLSQAMSRSQVRNTFLSVVVLVGLMMVVSSVMILVCETSPQSNIRTAGDALWWAFSTVTSVGYGDCYPVTAEGRIVAAILMTLGVGLFSTLTVYIAAFFLSTQHQVSKAEQQILDELKAVREQLARLNENASKDPTNK